MAAGVFPTARAPKVSPVLCVSFLLSLSAARFSAAFGDEPQKVESSLSRFEDALKIYDDVLKDDPKSAWALYERFQTELAKGLNANPNVMPDWSIARKAIIAADPLYESMAEASNMDEL
jgi:hypothetical protein